MEEAESIWKNGRLVPWQEATTHVLSHALNYGTSVFEGIRSYPSADGPRIFRLWDHVERFFLSAKIYDMKLPHAPEEIYDACKEVVRENGLNSAYIRPLAYYGYGGGLATTPSDDMPVDVIVAAFQWASFLGKETQTAGIDACVSSWNRVAPNTIPAGAKAGGNYVSSALIGKEARQNGYHEGIGLDADGRLSEGPGQNLFLIKGDKLYTPCAGSSILSGLTRDSIITLARDMGLQVVEQALPREMLYAADEAFFAGTAVEITPIRSVDRRPVGKGARGPVTTELQRVFFAMLNGQAEDRYNWLDPVHDRTKEASHGAKIAV